MNEERYKAFYAEDILLDKLSAWCYFLFINQIWQTDDRE